MPVKRVVLYKHGVGYFEREGAVSGDQSVALTFKQREVSDVLKSLTVLDLDGGTVAAVSYDATTPVEHLLAEIALTIPDAGSLIGLLPQLKGARVGVRPVGERETTAGVILGVDRSDTRTPTGIVVQPRLCVLTDAGEVKTFDLFDVTVQLLDESLRKDLDFYLRTQLASKKKDARAFTLFCQGVGKRNLRVSYVLEAPVWKATYRILLGEEQSLLSGDGSILAAADKPEGPFVQGWAVVDNTSDEDWVNVSLTLVAGLPVSFIHDLYTPRYIKRPVVEVKESTGVLPPMAEPGVDMDEAEAMYLAAPMAAGYGGGAAPGAMAKRRYAEITRGGTMRDSGSGVSSVQTQTRERQVGDLFEYVIDKPVTVRRNQSALVPIVLKPFAGRSVLLYQKAARAENPIRCVEFENTTGLTLEGGPVTVLESGSYVGEAMLDTLKPTEKRLVGYAVELAVRVTDTIDSFEEKVTKVVIRDGTLRTTHASVRQTTYVLVSKADKDQTLYLDHPRDGTKWKLTEPEKPHETTDNHWRFKFGVRANKTVKFVVRQQMPHSTTHALNDVTDRQLAAWVEAKYLDKPTLEVLKQVLKLRQELAGHDNAVVKLDKERDKIAGDQKRIRDNLGALADRASDKELRERYLRTLAQQEDRLEAIEGEAKKAAADREACRAKVDELLGKLAYEAAV